jgi:hypothetical protein
MEVESRVEGGMGNSEFGRWNGQGGKEKKLEAESLKVRFAEKK